MWEQRWVVFSQVGIKASVAARVDGTSRCIAALIKTHSCVACMQNIEYKLISYSIPNLNLLHPVYCLLHQTKLKWQGKTIESFSSLQHLLLFYFSPVCSARPKWRLYSLRANTKVDFPSFFGDVTAFNPKLLSNVCQVCGKLCFLQTFIFCFILPTIKYPTVNLYKTESQIDCNLKKEAKIMKNENNERALHSIFLWSVKISRVMKFTGFGWDSHE